MQNNAAIDVIERLAALQEKALLRDAEIRFNDALARIQAEVKRVAPDLLNPQTSSKYASYAAIDRVIRPIYTAEHMSLSFSDGECSLADHVRIVCYASVGAYTRMYHKDMPCDGKGARGGDVMTKTHAAAAADSYAKRYLVKNIFNIAIGEDDDDGNYGNRSTEKQPRIVKMTAKVIYTKLIENGNILVLKVQVGKNVEILTCEFNSTIRRLENTENTEIVVKCSQQHGEHGKVYWRVEEVLSAPERKKDFEKQKADLKPGEENHGHGNENTQEAQPEKKLEFIQPTITDVKRKLCDDETNEEKEFTWKQVRGTICAVSRLKRTSRGSDFIEFAVAGLPDRAVPGNEKLAHDTFCLRHKHLFECLRTAERGDVIVFDYSSEPTKKGVIWQNVEDIVSIAGRMYSNGELQNAGMELNFK